MEVVTALQLAKRLVVGASTEDYVLIGLALDQLERDIKRLPPVVVSVTEPAPIPQHIIEGAMA